MTEQPAHLPVMGLYYPYVHFRDERWLKLAALYWPKTGSGGAWWIAT